MSKELFKSYPSVDTFYITEDGQAFANEHHAVSHAKGGKITTIKREDSEGQKETDDKPEAKAKSSKAKK